MSWLARFACTRSAAESLARDAEPLDGAPTLVASEVDEASGRWELTAYFEDRPADAMLADLAERLGARRPAPERLPDQDWAVLSQAGLEPIRAGRFHVRTADHAPAGEPGVEDLLIQASRAFGTGHHATTRGCLQALDRLARGGRRFRRIADIGTGSGVLAFAAHRLWPQAAILASDIDPVAIETAERFADANQVPLGRGRGRLELLVAPGAQHRRIEEQAPYDLLVANILAGPLINLAAVLSHLLTDGGMLLLAGVTADQVGAVSRAYRRQGCRPLGRSGEAGWPVLHFVKRPRFGWRRPARAVRPAPGDTGEC